MAALLSLPPPARYPSLTLTPERQKQKTLEALLAWLLAEAKLRPVCLIVEDLHWTDPTTLEFLGVLLDHIPTAALYVLLPCRPEFQPAWQHRSSLTAVRVDVWHSDGLGLYSGYARQETGRSEGRDFPARHSVH